LLYFLPLSSFLNTEAVGFYLLPDVVVVLMWLV
jgi:hypothetical protein